MCIRDRVFHPFPNRKIEPRSSYIVGGVIVTTKIKYRLGRLSALSLIHISDLEDLLGPAKFAKDKEERRDEIGLVNGLAWTSVGGELLPIEVAVMLSLIHI